LLPEAAVQPILELLEKSSCELRISSPRKSKLGDFRAAYAGKADVITVNDQLHPLIFLTTLLHELAHLHVHRSGKRREAPHGLSWKKSYRELLQPFLIEEIFGPFLGDALKHWEKAPASWTRRDPLYKLLPQLSFPEYKHRLEELELGKRFETSGGRKFQSERKRRVRYLCLDLENGRKYLVHGQTPVKPIP
jgi:hypothetical protein